MPPHSVLVAGPTLANPVQCRPDVLSWARPPFRSGRGGCDPISGSRHGHIFLLIGPSGSGKTTLIRMLRQRRRDITFLPTTTTRPPRPGERNGVEYFFVTAAEFDAALAAGDFFEWQPVHAHRYGSSRTRFSAALAAGRLGITSLDILGGLAVKKALADEATTIFVRPSALTVLHERLLARGDTGGDDLRRRLRRAEMEIQQASRCDYIVINDDLDAALEQLERIVDRVTGSGSLESGAPAGGGPGTEVSD